LKLTTKWYASPQPPLVTSTTHTVHRLTGLFTLTTKKGKQLVANTFFFFSK